jgi:oxygen-independent coproporphyrinogen-3 oxidase
LGEQKAAEGPVRVIYFGGGTPSSLDIESLKSVAKALKESFRLANDCETTLEGAIHDFSPERIDGFLEAGFNRFSIGIQSFETEVRTRLGRRSSRETAIRRLKDLKERDMAAVIIDLIYGLPGQSLSMFETDLKIADDIGLDGLDTYQLNVFPKGPLNKAVEEGTIAPPALLSEQGRYFAKGYEFLTERRWRTLSLSHYAKTFRERNFYNPWAKRRADVLAVGAGAGGFLGSYAFYRLPNVDSYLKNAENNVFSPSFVTYPSPDEALSSFVVSEMETGSLNLARLFSDFNPDPEPLRNLFQNWEEAGLVSMKGDYLELTLSGRFWGVNLTQAVIDAAARS